MQAFAQAVTIRAHRKFGEFTGQGIEFGGEQATQGGHDRRVATGRGQGARIIEQVGPRAQFDVVGEGGTQRLDADRLADHRVETGTAQSGGSVAIRGGRRDRRCTA